MVADRSPRARPPGLLAFLSRLDEEHARHRAAVATLYAETFGPPELLPDPDGGPRFVRNPAGPNATMVADGSALLTYAAAARRLGFSKRALERLVRDGEIRPVRLGPRTVRFDPAALDAFAAARAARPAARTQGPKSGPSAKPAALAGSGTGRGAR